MIEERYGLAVERIREMKKEQTAKEPFTDYFHKMAEFVLMIDEVRDKLAQGRTCGGEQAALRGYSSGGV